MTPSVGPEPNGQVDFVDVDPVDFDPVEFDPADPRYLADPHAVFDGLRSPDRLVSDPRGWSTLSYAACDATFHDPALVPGIDPLLEHLGFEGLWGEPGHTLTDSDGEVHQRLRRAVSPWFTRRRIGAIRERTSALVNELLDAHEATDGSGEIDVMADVADVVPSRVFCWMSGADEADAELLSRLSKALLLVFVAEPWMVDAVRTAKAEMAEYTEALLARKRNDPGDDLASMLAAAATGGHISHDDAFHLLEELLSASVDNTANAVGLAVWTLAKHPGSWAALHADPSLLQATTAECGRYEPSIRHTIKHAVRDTELLGTTITAGSFVSVRIAAAHRDPLVFESPHTFDIRRTQTRGQLTFGAGRHYCLGAALGGMEVDEMVSAIVRRSPQAEIGEDLEMRVVESGHVLRLPLRKGPRTR